MQKQEQGVRRLVVLKIAGALVLAVYIVLTLGLNYGFSQDESVIRTRVEQRFGEKLRDVQSYQSEILKQIYLGLTERDHTVSSDERRHAQELGRIADLVLKPYQLIKEDKGFCLLVWQRYTHLQQMIAAELQVGEQLPKVIARQRALSRDIYYIMDSVQQAEVVERQYRECEFDSRADSRKAGELAKLDYAGNLAEAHLIYATSLEKSVPLIKQKVKANQKHVDTLYSFVSACEAMHRRLLEAKRAKAKWHLDGPLPGGISLHITPGKEEYAFLNLEFQVVGEPTKVECTGHRVKLTTNSFEWSADLSEWTMYMGDELVDHWDIRKVTLKGTRGKTLKYPQ